MTQIFQVIDNKSGWIKKRVICGDALFVIRADGTFAAYRGDISNEGWFVISNVRGMSESEARKLFKDYVPDKGGYDTMMAEPQKSGK